MEEESQQGPRLGNQFEEDVALQDYLKVFMGADLEGWKAELTRLGARTVEDLPYHHRMCELHKPEFEEYSAWGERINKIHTHPSWNYMHRVSCEEGLIRTGYLERKFNRLAQFVKLYLFSPSGGLYLCPLAMTDGAAFLLKHKLAKDPELESALSHILTEDPSQFWTCGQWMTEKMGGSDVSAATKTTATHISGDLYRLNGYKWFTSATTADATFTLARIEGKVSLFFVKVQQNLQRLRIVRLKDKLGTRQVPTAEIILENCIGKLVSPIGEGVKFISNLMNVTRLYNSVGAVSNMRRAVAIARDFSFRRMAFGKKIAELPLHKETMYAMELKVRGCLVFVLFMALLLEKTEKGVAEEWEVKSLRLLTPVIKLYTGKISSEVVKEAMEAIGGVAYMENSGFPNILRDTEVFSIWEGTTNVLSMDVSRVIQKSNDPELSFFATLIKRLSNDEELTTHVHQLANYAKIPRLMRKVSFEIGNIIIAALFHWVGSFKGNEIYIEIGKYWKKSVTENFLQLNESSVTSFAFNLQDGKPVGTGDIDRNGKPRYKI